jgi:hypothetical protein
VPTPELGTVCFMRDDAIQVYLLLAALGFLVAAIQAGVLGYAVGSEWLGPAFSLAGLVIGVLGIVVGWSRSWSRSSPTPCPHPDDCSDGLQWIWLRTRFPEVLNQLVAGRHRSWVHSFLVTGTPILMIVQTVNAGALCVAVHFGGIQDRAFKRWFWFGTVPLTTAATLMLCLRVLV